MKCRNLLDDVKTAVWSLLRDKLRRYLITGVVASGIEVAELANEAINGTWEVFEMMLSANLSLRPTKGKYRCTW